MGIFRLPDLGEGLAEAELREWYVKAGESVIEDQPLLTVETAKALVDIPAPQTGLVQTLHAQPGETVPVNAPLVTFASANTKQRNTKGLDRGTVVGKLATSPKAMPAIRVLAKKLNVDINQVTPTGPEGQITKQDIESAAQHSHTKLEKLQGARRTMAMTMHQSQMQVAPATIMDRANINHWPEHTDITTELIQAIASACKAEPSLNAHYHHSSLSRKLLSTTNLGIALDVGENLYMPVIHDLDQLDKQAIRKQLNCFKNIALQGNFSAENFKGPSIVLSNFGSIAGCYATPVVVPPTVAIIGAGRAFEDVIACQGKPVVHRVLPLSLTIDHRAVTGAEAARFLAAVIQHLEGDKAWP